MKDIIFLTSVVTPLGFYTYTTNSGIKNKENDTLVVYSNKICQLSAVFTRHLFASPSVCISKAHFNSMSAAQAVVVHSNNANVGNGEKGCEHTNSIVKKIANELSIKTQLIQIAATGIIGRVFPIDPVLKKLNNLSTSLETANFLSAANAIRTTDCYPKALSCKIGKHSVLTGIVKGVGMVEPNMATLLLYFFTDAQIEQRILNKVFKKVVNETWNCMSVDSDTSTSDTALIMSNGKSNESVSEEILENALKEMSTRLLKMVLLDGEGSSKLISITVEDAESVQQARKIGKSIANSPLVKTAIYGSDPNWGRILMAIGKCSEYSNLTLDNIQIFIGSHLAYPSNLQTPNFLTLCREYLKENKEIELKVRLEQGSCSVVTWGCDLTKDYVHFNSQYST